MWKRQLLAAIAMLTLTGCGASSPSPAAVPTATPLPTESPTLVSSATPTGTPTATATKVPTATATPANTPSDTPTSTPTPAPTNTLASTSTPKPTNTPLPTDMPIPPTNTPQAGAPPGSEILAAGVWRCPENTVGAVFVGSIQSDKFHYPGCRWAGKIKGENRICFASRDAAAAYAYLPCGTCKP